jgi:hypothetical protein
LTAECLEGEARVVVLAARRDALILLSVEELGEDDGGDGEEDEAEELVVDAEDEAGAVAVEALVNLNESKGKGQGRELFDSVFCMMILAGFSSRGGARTTARAGRVCATRPVTAAESTAFLGTEALATVALATAEGER